MCVCVRACVRACVRVCVRVRACVLACVYVYVLSCSITVEDMADDEVFQDTGVYSYSQQAELLGQSQHWRKGSEQW